MPYPLPATGLEWHFPFQGDRLDASGNGYVLTLPSGSDNFTGGGFYPTGVAARCGSGGANSGYPFVSTTQFLNKTQDWSLSFFVSHDTDTVDDYVCKIRSVDGAAFKAAYQKTANYNDFLLMYPSVVANKRFLLPGHANGTKYHIVITWDSATQAFIVFLDGAPVSVLSAGAGGAGTDTNFLGGNATVILNGYLAHAALNLGYKITEEESLAMAEYDPTVSSGGGVRPIISKQLDGGIINPDGIVAPGLIST